MKKIIRMSLTDSQNVYFLIYSGPELDEETTILMKRSTLSDLEEDMNWIAETQGLSGILLSLNVLVRDLLLDTYDIQCVTLDQILADPYSYGHWEKDSLWAIVNKDFSKIRTKRFTELMSKLNLPKLDLSLSRQRELLEEYSPDTYFGLGKHAETGETVPVMCRKFSPGKEWASTPNGKLVPVVGGMKLAPRPKIK